MIEGSLDERRQCAAPVALTAFVTAPAVHAFAESGQALQYDIDKIAIGLEIGPAFVGDGIARPRPGQAARVCDAPIRAGAGRNAIKKREVAKLHDIGDS